MRAKLLMLGLALAVSSNAEAADHSVSVVSTGINLYTATLKGIALAKGSPFIPSTAIFSATPGCPSTPVVMPSLVAESRDHQLVYALYVPCLTFATLIEYKIQDSKLVQIATTGPIGQISGAGNHKNEAVSMVAGPHESVVIYLGLSEQGVESGAMIFNENLAYSGIAKGYFSADGDARFELTSLEIDPHGQFYYVCAQSTSNGAVNTTVSEYASDSDFLTAGSAIGGTLVSRSTDPLVVSAFCPQ